MNGVLVSYWVSYLCANLLLIISLIHHNNNCNSTHNDHSDDNDSNKRENSNKGNNNNNNHKQNNFGGAAEWLICTCCTCPGGSGKLICTYFTCSGGTGEGQVPTILRARVGPLKETLESGDSEGSIYRILRVLEALRGSFVWFFSRCAPARRPS